MGVVFLKDLDAALRTAKGVWVWNQGDQLEVITAMQVRDAGQGQADDNVSGGR